MAKPIEQMLQQVAEETFENLAFMFPMEEDEAQCAAADKTVTASVDFSGPFGGTLFLSLPESMLPMLVSNMLGLDEESPAPEQLADGVKELLNIICGNLLPVFAGKAAVFNVHAPMVRTDGIPASLDEHEAVADAKLCLDSGRGALRLFLRQPVPALAGA